MKREFLKELGIADEAIEKIMAEYGKSMTAKQTDLDAANTTIRTLQDAAKKFDGVDLDKLRADLANAEKKYKDDMYKVKFENAMQRKLSPIAKNPKALKALLDIDKLKYDDEKDDIPELDSQLEALKKSDPHEFKDTFTPGAGGVPGANNNNNVKSHEDELRKAMGLSPQK